MAKVTVEDGKIRYRKFLSVCELPVADLVWAYLQQEDVSAKMCCGSYHGEIGRVIVRDRNGKKQIFHFERIEVARELLEKLQGVNPELAIGYTVANRIRFVLERWR